MGDHWNNRELSVTLAMLLPAAVSYLLLVIHCILECMLSGHKGNWQGCFVLLFFSWEEKGRTRNVLDFRSRRIIFVIMAHAACAGFNQLCLFYFPVHTTEVFRFNTSNNYKWCAPARTKLHGKLRKKCLCKSHGRKSAWTQKVELGLGHRGINAK